MAVKIEVVCGLSAYLVAIHRNANGTEGEAAGVPTKQQQEKGY